MLGALTTHAVALAPDFLQTQRHLSRGDGRLAGHRGRGTGHLGVQLAPGRCRIATAARWWAARSRRLAVVGALLFFFVARSPLAFAGAIAMTLSGSLGARPALGAFTSELFTTPLRAFGGATVSVALVIGEVISLALGGLLLRPVRQPARRRGRSHPRPDRDDRDRGQVVPRDPRAGAGGDQRHGAPIGLPGGPVVAVTS